MKIRLLIGGIGIVVVLFGAAFLLGAFEARIPNGTYKFESLKINNVTVTAGHEYYNYISEYQTIEFVVRGNKISDGDEEYRYRLNGSKIETKEDGKWIDSGLIYKDKKIIQIEIDILSETVIEVAYKKV